MITQHQKELLVDLAKLFDKYGTKPFEDLADLLSSPETIKVWVNFLRDSSLAAREAGFEQSGEQKQQPRRTINAELELIKFDNPKKYQTLTRFYDTLRNKAILPNLGDIRNFAQDRGLPLVTAKSREKAISPLIKSMIPLDADVIKEMTKSLVHSHAESLKLELKRIKSEDPEKHKALTRFHDELLSKTVLPELRDVRNFAQDHSLPVVTAKSRAQAIVPLLHSMILLDTNAINEITESLPHSPPESFNDLEEWSKIIMGEKRE